MTSSALLDEIAALVGITACGWMRADTEKVGVRCEQCPYGQGRMGDQQHAV